MVNIGNTQATPKLVLHTEVQKLESGIQQRGDYSWKSTKICNIGTVCRRCESDNSTESIQFAAAGPSRIDVDTIISDCYWKSRAGIRYR